MNGGGSHRIRDAEKLALHVAIAEQLRSDPERVLAVARANLVRWQTSMGVQPYHERWLAILDEWSVDDMVAAIMRDDEEGRSLRQSTPFVGVLGADERDLIVRVARVTARAHETLGDCDKANRWLSKPNRQLGGKRPLDVLTTEDGALAVESLLGRIDHGIVG